MSDPIICDHCGKECWSDMGFMQHLIAVHGILIHATPLEYTSETDEDNNGGPDAA